MSGQDVILTDAQVLAVSSGEWPLPETGNGICDQWRDAFIATRLQDVLARRYYDTSFAKLDAEDRNRIRQRVEQFVEATSLEFAVDPVEQVRR